jgi:hypothetical protein
MLTPGSNFLSPLRLRLFDVKFLNFFLVLYGWQLTVPGEFRNRLVELVSNMYCLTGCGYGT